MDADNSAENNTTGGAPAGPVVGSVEPAAPVQPIAPAGQAPAPGAKPVTNPGLIVLQWLTYAFWGWTVLSLSILTTLVVNHYLNDADSAGFMPYGIAAILVLLPLSFVLDAFYSKKEPEHKVGAEIWVMVFHVVVFALFGIGSLIAAVIALVMMITNGTDTSGTKVALISALIIFVYYGLTFVRTLNPPSLRKYTKWYKMVMLVSVGVIALLGIIGPMAKERATKNDRLITSSISGVESGINRYTNDKNRLPDSLKSLELKGDAKKLVEVGLVDYKPEGKYQDPEDKSLSTTYKVGSTSGPDEYRYQLCVTYKQESSSYGKYSSIDYGPDSDSEYQSSLYVYDHPKGNVCYKLKVEVY